MNHFLNNLKEMIPSLWNRRWFGVAAAWCVGLIGLLVILLVPDRYEASAKVFVDTQTVLKPLMTGLAVQPDVKEQINMIARTMVSRPNIEKMLKLPANGLQLLDNAKNHDAVVDSLLKGIKIDIEGRENIFTITYRDASPEQAKRVVQGLVDLFVASGLGNNERDSAAAQQFIDDQIRGYEVKLREAENRLKDFKLRNLGYTGQEANNYFQRVSQASEELINLRGQLHAAEQGRESLRHQLAGEEPAMIPDASTGLAAPVRSDTEIRLDEQRKILDDLLRRFTDEHPDVVATRRLIAQLEQQRRSEQDALRNGDSSHSIRYSQATNPVFQKLKLSLADADANVASLQARVGDLQERLNQLHAAAGRIPQVDEEYAQLNRDYDVIRKNYDQLVSRRESAQISEEVSASSQMANFRVIEPTRVSPQPKFPSHGVLAVLFLVLSICAGFGGAYLVTQAFPSFYSLRDLHRITKRPSLGRISLLTVGGERTLLTSTSAFVGALVALMMLHLVVTTLALVR